MDEAMGADLMKAAERFGRFAKEFHAESDRGCAILVLCVLEEALHDLFRAYVVGEQPNLSNLAPPGRLKVAISNAVLIGLLSERQAQSFRALASIRNKFAHQVMEGLTFDTPEIASAVKAAEMCVEMPMKDWRATLNNRNLKTEFLMLASALWLVLHLKTRTVKRLEAAGDPQAEFVAQG